MARIRRELIELAEGDADAKLADAPHDALEVALPAAHACGSRCRHTVKAVMSRRLAEGHETH